MYTDPQKMVNTCYLSPSFSWPGSTEHSNLTMPQEQPQNTHPSKVLALVLMYNTRNGPRTPHTANGSGYHHNGCRIVQYAARMVSKISYPAFRHTNTAVRFRYKLSQCAIIRSHQPLSTRGWLAVVRHSLTGSAAMQKADFLEFQRPCGHCCSLNSSVLSERAQHKSFHCAGTARYCSSTESPCRQCWADTLPGATALANWHLASEPLK